MKYIHTVLGTALLCLAMTSCSDTESYSDCERMAQRYVDEYVPPADSASADEHREAADLLHYQADEVEACIARVDAD